MSGIAGFWNFDGAPADALLLGRMTDAIEHRGPDGIATIIDGQLAMSQCSLRTTPESIREAQPLWDESRNYCLVMDGRIDNRDELSATLQPALRDDTDAELLLQAYIAWGESALARFVGDFAFVIWDKPRRRLFCARDPLGIRPFYYYRDRRTFLWASEPRALLQHHRVSSRPNEHMIAELLADCVSNQDETLNYGIHRLPPACSLIVTGQEIRVARYWEPPANRIHYRHDTEYADHLHTLLTEAIRCRLRAPQSVACELSGGLDSSTVVALAKPLADAAGQQLEAFSMIYPGLPCDESGFIDAVASNSGVTAHKSQPSPHPSWVDRAARRFRDFPGYPNGAMHASLWQSAIRRGHRVILTGLGGDEWLGGFDVATPRKRVRQRLAADPYLRALLRKPRLCPWIHPGLARRANLTQSYLTCSADARDARTFIRSGQRAFALEVQDRLAASVGVELRHPFNDVRLVSFVAQLPPHQFRRKDETKWALRQAMRGVLPEIVRNRRSKAEFSHVFARGLGIIDGRPSFDWTPLVDLGFLAAPDFSNLWEDMRQAWLSGQQDGLPHAWPLWNARALCAWIAAESSHSRSQHLAA